MYKKAMLALGVVISIFVSVGCKSMKESTEIREPDNPVQTIPPEKEGSGAINVTPSPKPDEVLEKIKKLSLEEKIGQMVIAGVDAYTNDEHSTQLIQKYHVGGFILLGQNVKDANQNLNLLNSLKDINNSSNKIPLFLGVDQEGGKIDRMPVGINKLPANKSIGKAGSGEFAYSMGKILGQEVKSFGYNLDFAPVIDINNNPNNPVIGDRAFGAEPKVVTTMGIETMKGIRSQNVISVVKHFPGHGDTATDSHTGLPIVNNDLSRLRSFELLPFAEAVKNDVDMIMAAHILFPKIDAQNPASMSKRIITELLRNEMNYKGIVITDDMTMGAIVKKYDIGKAAVSSVNAGCDIILVCHDFDKETAVLNALKDAVKSGQITTKTIDDSVYKILKLKQKYQLKDEKLKKVDINVINDNIKSMLDKYVK